MMRTLTFYVILPIIVVHIQQSQVEPLQQTLRLYRLYIDITCRRPP
jgi:hypothetical protein